MDDMKKEPNEANRFGWVVEIDPYDPKATPVKHTAMGRMAHEGATVILARDGRPVAYMGDDARFEYLFKFVTAGRFDPNNRQANLHLLDSGILYVARSVPTTGCGSWTRRAPTAGAPGSSCRAPSAARSAARPSRRTTGRSSSRSSIRD